MLPYSPELNPVELIWRKLRKKYFNNGLFEELDELENQLVNSLQHFFQNKKAVNQLTNFQWLKL